MALGDRYKSFFIQPAKKIFVTNMKKLLIIVLMLVYGIPSMGATIHLHYCCGKLDNITFSTQHNKSCPQKEKLLKNCCDSKQVDLKIKVDQESGTKWLTTYKDFSAPPSFTSFYIASLVEAEVLHPFSTGPPLLWPNVPLYIRHCVFRI